MKLNQYIYTLLFVCIALVSSCQNDVLNAGASTLGTEDHISV